MRTGLCSLLEEDHIVSVHSSNWYRNLGPLMLSGVEQKKILKSACVVVAKLGLMQGRTTGTVVPRPRNDV